MAGTDSTQRVSRPGRPRKPRESTADRGTFVQSPHERPDERRETGSALGRAIAMLETLIETDGALGMQELCTRLDLPRQSAHRILNQLLELKLLQRDVGREQFSIGPRLRTLAFATVYHTHRTGPRHSVLERLARDTGETCNLGVLEQNKVLLVDRIESDFALRVHSEVGRRLEPHASAIGKLLLAHLPKGRRAHLLKQALPLKSFTEHTLTDLGALEAEFATIRKQGYSMSNQGTTLGMLSVAAPVSDMQGKIVAGLAVQAPFVRMGFDRARREIVPLLLSSAQQMSDLLVADEREATSVSQE